MTTATNPYAERLYTRQFFQVFAAAGLFMTGVALQFHFGQYVEFIGYGVDMLGLIMSISIVGTLLIRLHIGRWIDRLGCRPTWLVGTVVVALAVGSIQFTQQVWLIILLRALSRMAMASVMTTVAVFAAQIAPRGRRTESIGMIGLAGFLGMIIGPTLGDWIFSGSTDAITPYRVFFSASAICSLLAGGVILLPVRQAFSAPGGHGAPGTGEPQASARADVRAISAACSIPQPSQIRVILDHWPGVILLVGEVFSMVFCLQSSFLERLAEERGFKDIKVFFLVYGPTAITLRVLCRRVPERFGRSRTLFGGLLLLAAGLLCLTGIESQWQLVLPGLLMGAGHCFIFPSMVDLAAERLPFEYRGTGTALILGAGDVGMLLGYVGLGELIDSFGFDAAIITLAATVLVGAAVFGLVRRDAVLRR
jgi:MFS family permease